MSPNQEFSERESLQLITEMINKTKQSFHDTGFGPIMWGSVITFCSLVTFASSHFNFTLPFDIWWLTLIALGPQVIYSIIESKRKQAKTYNDIAMDYTWIAFGISIGILTFIINALAADLKNSIPNYMEVRGSFRLFNHTTAMHLMLYGIPTFITGGIMKFKPMLFGAIICWILGMVSIFTQSQTDMLLLAAGAIAAWLIPGILLNKIYRAAKNGNV
jgi:FtsH-binding integral membrane protein